MLLRLIKDEVVMGTAEQALRSAAFKVYHSLYRRPIAQFSKHVKHAAIPRETLRRSVRSLIELEWIVPVDDPHRGTVIVPWMPLQVEEFIASELRRRIKRRPHYGESLMRCQLDLIIDDRRYEDNARPEWLVPGDGGGPMELDRWYEDAMVAFEFQGWQHYRAGDLSSEAQLIAQRTRDRIKAGLCAQEGIRFIEITALDLNMPMLRQKIGDALPWFPVFEDRPLYKTVQQLCHSYMNSIARHTQRELSKHKET